VTDHGSRSVYVAADFSRAGEAEFLASRLREAGTNVVSSWHSAGEAFEVAAAGKVGGPPADAARNAAVRNIRELESADTVLVMTTGQRARGGRHFETGYAHALKKRILLVGVVEHAFHHLDGIDVVETVDAAVARCGGS
jgi:nucleoside 2-deoxyribosyltransferase